MRPVGQLGYGELVQLKIVWNRDVLYDQVLLAVLEPPVLAYKSHQSALNEQESKSSKRVLAARRSGAAATPPNCKRCGAAAT